MNEYQNRKQVVSRSTMPFAAKSSRVIGYGLIVSVMMVLMFVQN